MKILWSQDQLEIIYLTQLQHSPNKKLIMSTSIQE